MATPYNKVVLLAVLYVFSSSIVSADPIGSGETPPCGSPTHQHALVIPVDYPDQANATPKSTVESRYFGSSNSLKDYWNEVSYGKLTLDGNVHDWVTIDVGGTGSCGTGVTAALNQVSAEVDLTPYNLIIIETKLRSGCPLPRSQTMDCSNGRRIYYNYESSLDVAIHEAGHAIGLGEADSEEYYAEDSSGVELSLNPIGKKSEVIIEYGNIFDVMGGGAARYNIGPYHYNASSKYFLGFLSDETILKVKETGSYTIGPLSTPLIGPKAIRVFRGAYISTGYDVPKKLSKEYIWIETRSDSGYDSMIDSKHSGASSAFGGAVFNLQRDDESSILIDVHPGTASGNSDLLNAPLQAYQSFIDTFTNTIYTHEGVVNGNITVSVSLNPLRVDSDEDGLTDMEESSYGTNPNLEDTDGDGIPDYVEVCFDGDCTSYNPGVTDTNATLSDTDNDGLSDYFEFRIGIATNPLSIDTDGDGLSDLAEINDYGTDAKKIDTDGDGLSDYDEVITFSYLGLNAVNGYSDTDADLMSDDWEMAYGTNWLVNDASVDSDNDGVVNLLEFYRGTNPLDVNSSPVFKTVYVSNSGDPGTENGSEQYPYTTLSKGIGAALAGDTISMAAGNYSAFDLFANLARKKPLKFIGPKDRSAIISGNSLNVGGQAWGGISQVTFDISILIIAESKNYTIENSNIKVGEDIWVHSKTNVTFKNNLIEATSGAGEAFWIDNTAHVDLINNTIVDFPVGLRVEAYLDTTLGEPAGTAAIRNTIFANTVDFVGDISRVSVSYSLLRDAPFSGSNGNLNIDPLFMNPGVGDYHLQPTSPAIDAGDPADDSSQEPNPGGCRINMGAYGNTVEAATGPDVDDDLLSTYCEGVAGTDPSTADSDGDGLSDGEEVIIHGTNPLLADTDYDGLSDGQEIDLGLNPLLADAQEDADGDGVITYLEVLRGTNPSDNTSAPDCRTLYVATNGNRENDGLTPATPKTFSGPGGSALNIALDCDVISLASGTYTGGYTSAKALHLIGAGSGSVTITGTQNVGVLWGIFEGITFDNAFAFTLNGAYNVTLRNNVFKHGLLVINGSKNIHAQQNVIVGNTTPDGYPGAYAGVDIRQGSSVDMINNTIVSNQRGVRVDRGSVVEIHNSIIWGNGQEDLVGVDASWVSYSDISDTNFVGIGSNGNIRMDPLFVNAGVGDYHLQPTSPVLGAGECTNQLGAYGGLCP